MMIPATEEISSPNIPKLSDPFSTSVTQQNVKPSTTQREQSSPEREQSQFQKEDLPPQREHAGVNLDDF